MKCLNFEDIAVIELAEFTGFTSWLWCQSKRIKGDSRFESKQKTEFSIQEDEKHGRRTRFGKNEEEFGRQCKMLLRYS